MCRVVYLRNTIFVTKIFCYQYSTINNFATKLYFLTKFGDQLSNLLGIKCTKFNLDSLGKLCHFYCAMSRGLLSYWTQCIYQLKDCCH